MGVGPAVSVSSTNFVVPVNVDDGPAVLEVIANGIASRPRTTTIGPAPANGGPMARGCGMGALVPIGLAAVAALVQAVSALWH